MQQDQPQARAQAATTLETLIEELGAWRVLRATLKALARRRRVQPHDARALSAHIRRDIGLPPAAGPPVWRGQLW
jgi:hypothetical protein